MAESIVGAVNIHSWDRSISSLLFLICITLLSLQLITAPFLHFLSSLIHLQILAKNVFPLNIFKIHQVTFFLKNIPPVPLHQVPTWTACSLGLVHNYGHRTSLYLSWEFPCLSSIIIPFFFDLTSSSSLIFFLVGYFYQYLPENGSWEVHLFYVLHCLKISSLTHT